jgi:hypothetical protein
MLPLDSITLPNFKMVETNKLLGTTFFCVSLVFFSGLGKDLGISEIPTLLCLRFKLKSHIISPL